jgi:hypothetical protein
VRSWMGRMGWKGSQAEATRMENTCRKEDEEMGGRVCISVGRGGGGGSQKFQDGLPASFATAGACEAVRPTLPKLELAASLMYLIVLPEGGQSMEAQQRCQRLSAAWQWSKGSKR